MEYQHSIKDVMDLATSKVNIPTWQPYVWEKIEGGDLVTGCVPDGAYTRGPRKGRPRFGKPIPGTRKVVAVTKMELDTRAAQYEATEGKCWRCKGEGSEFAGWSVTDGVRQRTCQRCNGSGVPPNYR